MGSLVSKAVPDELDFSNQPEPILSSFDVEGIADKIRDGQCKRIIVMAGAGISVSAGIPDFRTPGTGLYDNLQKYNLPSPESVFDIQYFKHNPDAFYQLSKEMWPDNFKPTPSHHFVRLLHDKGMLQRCFTQNIDSLERKAGLPPDLIVAAHGNFDEAHCIDTGKSVPIEEVRAAILAGKDGPDGWLALAEKHAGLVKPDIVFFGEALPARFGQLAMRDFPQCDLLIVMGTSLQVQPFASLTGRVSEDTPRLLINRERVGETDPGLAAMGLAGEDKRFNFREGNYRDALFLGDCDAGVAELVKHLGWEQEWQDLVTGRGKTELNSSI